MLLLVFVVVVDGDREMMAPDSSWLDLDDSKMRYNIRNGELQTALILFLEEQWADLIVVTTLVSEVKVMSFSMEDHD